jgi:hypothetical protein
MPSARLGVDDPRLLQRADLGPQHLLHLGILVDRSLARTVLIPHHAHALITRVDKLLSLREPTLMLTSDVVRITHQKGHWTPGPPRTEECSEDITLTW